MKKYTIEEIYNYFKSRNLEIIDISNYKNSKSKITIRDTEGYLYLLSPNEFMQYNSTFKPFATFNPYTILNIKQFLKNGNYKNKLISTKYKGTDSKLTFTCAECEKEYEVSFKHFRNSNQIFCRRCAKENSIKGRRKNINEIKELFAKKGFVILSEEGYTNNSDKIIVMDELGYKSVISYSSTKVSEGVKIFSKTNPFTVYNIKRYIQMNNINTKIISNEYLGKDELLEFECECGNKYNTRLGTFIKLNKHRCDECSKKQSMLSMLTEKYLKERGFVYVREYSFDDCINKRRLYFDFCVFKGEEKILIECDGEQHFKPVNFNGISDELSLESYIKTVSNDNIKNNYCIKNNLKLIRIPYWEYNNDNYIKTLDLKLDV